MKPQRASNVRLAFWVTTVVFFCGFMLGWTAKARACDSYESCLDSKTETCPYGFNKESGRCWADGETNTLRAIAFKLSEISDKLDRQQNPMVNMAESYLNKKEGKK